MHADFVKAGEQHIVDLKENVDGLFDAKSQLDVYARELVRITRAARSRTGRSACPPIRVVPRARTPRGRRHVTRGRSTEPRDCDPLPDVALGDVGFALWRADRAFAEGLITEVELAQLVTADAAVARPRWRGR
jgi:hypothetical protein